MRNELNPRAALTLAIWSLMGMTCMLLLAQSPVRGEDEENPGGTMPVPDHVCARLQTLFQKYYPKATFTNEGLNGIHFEYEVTTFESPYTGPPRGKHEATTHRGPKKGGIECSIFLEKGKYRGQVGLAARGFSRPGHLPRNHIHIPSLSQPPLSPNENSQYELLINRGVYKTLLMAPYSAKRDAHLWGSVSYPPDASGDFLKEFCALMDAFGEDAD